jgi:hypothetical protein
MNVLITAWGLDVQLLGGEAFRQLEEGSLLLSLGFDDLPIIFVRSERPASAPAME